MDSSILTFTFPPSTENNQKNKFVFCFLHVMIYYEIFFDKVFYACQQTKILEVLFPLDNSNTVIPVYLHGNIFICPLLLFLYAL